MKNLIYGTALMMIMAISTSSFAGSHFSKDEKAKTENKSNYGKKDDVKKGQGKKGSCHHHNKKACHKK